MRVEPGGPAGPRVKPGPRPTASTGLRHRLDVEASTSSAHAAMPPAGPAPARQGASRRARRRRRQARVGDLHQAGQPCSRGGGVLLGPAGRGVAEPASVRACRYDVAVRAQAPRTRSTRSPWRPAGPTSRSTPAASSHARREYTRSATLARAPGLSCATAAAPTAGRSRPHSTPAPIRRPAPSGTSSRSAGPDRAAAARGRRRMGAGPRRRTPASSGRHLAPSHEPADRDRSATAAAIGLTSQPARAASSSPRSSGGPRGCRRGAAASGW